VGLNGAGTVTDADLPGGGESPDGGFDPWRVLPVELRSDPVTAGMVACASGPTLRRAVDAIVAGWDAGRRPVAGLRAAGWSWEDIEALVRAASGVQRVSLGDYRPDVAAIVSAGFPACRLYHAMPLEPEPGGQRLVAVADPDDLEVVDFVRGSFPTAAGVPRLVCADVEEIDTALSSVERSAAAAEMAAASNAAEAESSDFLPEAIDALAEGPHVSLINSVFEQAVAAGASDVHFTPAGAEMRISIRVDGVIYELSRQQRRMAEKIVLALKQMARVSVIEYRLPQDGVIPHVLPSGRRLEMRASFIPGAYEMDKVTLRVVDRSRGVVSLDALGLSERVFTSLKTVLRSNYGVLLVAGPTGSGKTTTLYAVLDGLNDGKSNILTVEDPVEVTMPGIHQVQVNAAIGLTFGSVLARFLRADPDIMLVGEIRDTETAETAMQAAQTGHLVVSTVHTNSAAGAAPRLIQMGVAPYAVASGLIGVLNQRLIRRLCPACRTVDVEAASSPVWGGCPPDTELWTVNPKGCIRCNYLGYRGRTPVAELLVVDEPIREAIVASESAARIETVAVAAGMVPMHLDALEKVRSGMTSLSEYAKFTGTLELSDANV